MFCKIKSKRIGFQFSNMADNLHCLLRAIKFLETGQTGDYERMEGETEMATGESQPLPPTEEDKDISVIPVTSNQSEANQITTNQNVLSPGDTQEEAVDV